MNHTLSINVDEVGKNILEIIPFLKRNSIHYLELRTINDKNIANFELNDVQIIKEEILRSNHHISISALASPLFKWYLEKPDVIRSYDSFNFPCILSHSEKRLAIDRVINVAQELNCQKVRVFTGLSNESKPSTEKILSDDLFQYCLHKAQEKNISILVENEPVCHIHTVNDMEMLLETFDNLDLWLDVANFYQVNEDFSLRELERFLPRIRHVHLKDLITRDSQMRYVPLGCGDIPWEEILCFLFKYSNYEISFSIETHVSADKISSTEESINFYRDIEKLFTGEVNP